MENGDSRSERSTEHLPSAKAAGLEVELAELRAKLGEANNKVSRAEFLEDQLERYRSAREYQIRKLNQEIVVLQAEQRVIGEIGDAKGARLMAASEQLLAWHRIEDSPKSTLRQQLEKTRRKSAQRKRELRRLNQALFMQFGAEALNVLKELIEAKRQLAYAEKVRSRNSGFTPCEPESQPRRMTGQDRQDEPLAYRDDVSGGR